ncbi:hypothetical protein [Dysgonomonas macrotermitis]|uniref:hypothetical protein n=1 Tax=Dysgonomonas macrotermitis TaxID=1346286 RepID=UPI000782A1BF|nr:hypothetical protein [Dysgonomonas macrotermitis]
MNNQLTGRQSRELNKQKANLPEGESAKRQTIQPVDRINSQSAKISNNQPAELQAPLPALQSIDEPAFQSSGYLGKTLTYN